MPLLNIDIKGAKQLHHGFKEDEICIYKRHSLRNFTFQMQPYLRFYRPFRMQPINFFLTFKTKP